MPINRCDFTDRRLEPAGDPLRMLDPGDCSDPRGAYRHPTRGEGLSSGDNCFGHLPVDLPHTPHAGKHHPPLASRVTIVLRMVKVLMLYECFLAFF